MMDIERVRADTPGTRHGIHLLACGAALMPQQVVDAIVAHTELEARIGGYEAYRARAEELDATYDSVARLLNAKPQEIALVENATVGWCMAFYSLPLKAGDRILTCEAEYAANYVAFLQRAKRDGIIIDVVPSDASGGLDVVALEEMITEQTALIATTWIPTNGGLINPAEKIGAIAKQHDIPFLLDACQAVGQMPVDVEALQCDFLSATARKFLRGPRGSGFLYVREKWLETLEPVMIDHFAAPWVSRDAYELRPDARRFENWENNYALRAGLKAACDYALELGLDAIQQRSFGLATLLREQLLTLPGAQIRDIGAEQCAIVSFTIEGLDPAVTVNKLRENGIAIGTSTLSSTRIDGERRQLPLMLRAAPHYYNTEEDIFALIAALKAEMQADL
ncbi:aminotransferase class V-fold PLP-dependent enzyme [Cohaesibacter sp. CAU 1516]|nr:aminotransferase class V-fold PLP-dependent enzyme [Cohaesibacter sp. CAU 1516]